MALITFSSSKIINELTNFKITEVNDFDSKHHETAIRVTFQSMIDKNIIINEIYGITDNPSSKIVPLIKQIYGKLPEYVDSDDLVGKVIKGRAKRKIKDGFLVLRFDGHYYYNDYEFEEDTEKEIDEYKETDEDYIDLNEILSNSIPPIDKATSDTQKNMSNVVDYLTEIKRKNLSHEAASLELNDKGYCYLTSTNSWSPRSIKFYITKWRIF